MNSALSAVGAGILAGSDADGMMVVQQQRDRITGRCRLVLVVLEENNATECLRKLLASCQIEVGRGTT